MTPLDVTLTPAQREHYDRHGWTLTEAPTPVQLPDAAGAYPVGPAAPVPATVLCLGCLALRAVNCSTCSGSGVVPRTVGIVRPERECGGRCKCSDPAKFRWTRCDGHGVIPAERVGTATVTPLPVEDDPACEEWEKFVYSDPYPKVWLMSDDALEHDVTALFATPPNPGTTVWRLDKENNDG